MAGWGAPHAPQKEAPSRRAWLHWKHWATMGEYTGFVPDKIPCPQCQTHNDPGSRFCLSCGANLTPQVHCPACNTLNPVDHRFCIRCGGALEGAGWAGPGERPPTGAVIDGVWERGADEIIRRVDPEDARRFLG